MTASRKNFHPADTMKPAHSTLLTAFLLTLFFSAATSRGGPLSVPGTANPWLAGMPDGSTASLGDVAPDQSPVLVTGLTLVPGQPLLFIVKGGVHFDPGPLSPPDGSLVVGGHNPGPENGIAYVAAPLDALMGVFLGPDQPNLSSPPASLDFRSPESRDYTTFAPLLKQVFFIGDGLTGAGERQQVMVPPGATRLFLGPMDGSGWHNNIGQFSVWGLPVSTAGVTEVDVTYTNLATPTGPISFGLTSLPDSVPAQFFLKGGGTGATTFDSNDVLFAELTFGDGTWTEDELVNFSMTVDALGEVTSLTYQFGSITTPTAVSGPVLNSSFTLTVSGTDIASGQEFEYVHLDSMQDLTVYAVPALLITNIALMLGGIVLSGTGGTSNSLFRVLSSADVTMPVTNWPAISTNTFDADGNFSLTNPVSPGTTQ
jgi:hypothetical protein